VSCLGLCITPFAQTFKLLLQDFQLLIGKMFSIDKAIAGTMHSIDEFIKLRVDRLGIMILSILDEKHHKEDHNGRTCVDN
jgi:hypothetical protein